LPCQLLVALAAWDHQTSRLQDCSACTCWQRLPCVPPQITLQARGLPVKCAARISYKQRKLMRGLFTPVSPFIFIPFYPCSKPSTLIYCIHTNEGMLTQQYMASSLGGEDDRLGLDPSRTKCPEHIGQLAFISVEVERPLRTGNLGHEGAEHEINAAGIGFDAPAYCKGQHRPGQQR